MEKINKIKERYRNKTLSYELDNTFLMNKRLTNTLIVISAVLILFGLVDRLPIFRLSFWAGIIILLLALFSFQRIEFFVKGFKSGFEEGWDGAWKQQDIERLKLLKSQENYIPDLIKLKKNLADEIDDIVDI